MRITRQSTADAVAAAFGMMPEVIADMLRGVHILDVDPVAAGLHRFEGASFGRSYRNIGHVVYPWHVVRPYDEKITTVVLPTVENAEPWIVIHELGHVLDERTGFRHTLMPVTSYAATDRTEAFAEAFRFYVMYDEAGRERIGRKAVDVFDRLADR